jgi:hypothetical protein
MIRYKMHWWDMPWGNAWIKMEDVEKEMKRLKKEHPDSTFKVWKVTTTEEEVEL